MTHEQVQGEEEEGRSREQAFRRTAVIERGTQTAVCTPISTRGYMVVSGEVHTWIDGDGSGDGQRDVTGEGWTVHGSARCVSRKSMGDARADERGRKGEKGKEGWLSRTQAGKHEREATSRGGGDGVDGEHAKGQW